MKDGQYTEQGFLSSATKLREASAFGKSEGDYKNILVFSLPKGGKGLYISANENEVLLQQGQKVQLIGVREVSQATEASGHEISNNVRLLFCELV